MFLLAVMLLTAIPFSATAANAYWGFDDYVTVDYPGAPEEITSYPTTIKKVSNSTYTMSSTISGVGTLSISLIEEAWGTFNLGNWILKDTSGVSHEFVGASTDMEYVHQYYYSDSHVTWSGGNHGGEALESLKFYDGVTGNEISLSVGGSHTSNVIHCIQKTKLLHFPDQNPKDSINDYNKKSISYTEDQVYAKLTRKYTFTGPQIKLNVDYLYMKDSYHARNYLCMLPIAKKYGLYCDMIDQNGVKIKTITTSEVGKADYSGPTNGGNAATRAVVYSKTNPKYQFDMRVTTFKDGLNEFKDANFKTAFWDMNTNHNKLYFTRFDDTKKVLHAKNSTVNTECIWLFRYSADGSLPTYQDAPVGEVPASRNKTYTNPVSDAVQGDGVNTKYGAKLTDGIASEGFAYNDDSWSLLFNNHNAADGIGTIIIDMGEVYDLTKFRAHLANYSGAGVGAPKSLKVFGSMDGNDYTELSALTLNTGADAIYWTEATAPANSQARYVKFVFELNGTFAYLNELEVYGEVAQNVFDADNLAYGKAYTAEGIYTNADGSQVYPDENGKSLTDGIIADLSATYSHEALVGFNANTDFYQQNGYAAVTVDLEKVYDLNKLAAYVSTANEANVGAGVKTPKSIDFYVSNDNVNWKSVGSVVPAQGNDSTVAVLTLDTPVAGRYVQYRMVAATNWLMASEVKAYGEEHTHDDGEWVTTKEPQAGVPGEKELRCTGCGHVLDTDTIDALPTAMKGDFNGNGEIDSVDYAMLKRTYFGIYGVDLSIGDINGNEEIDSIDYSLLKRAYFGLYILE